MITTLREAFPRLNRVPPEVSNLGLSLDSHIDAMDELALERLLPAIVQHLGANDQTKLASMVTVLGMLGDIPLKPSIHQSHLRKALARAGIYTWRDLGELSPADLRRLPGIGSRKANDILRCCVTQSILSRSERQKYIDAGLYKQQEDLEEAVENLRILAAWAVRERKVAHAADLWHLAPGIGMTPDLQELWNNFASLRLAVIADAALTEVHLEQLVGELLESLDDTERAVYERRVLSNSPRTLEEVGQELGFTRERARQLQVGAEECIQSLLTSRRFLPLWWRARELRSVLGRAAPRECQSTSEILARCLRDVRSDACPVVESLLLRLAGPYRYREGWLELADLPDLPATSLASLADPNGTLPLAAAYEWLAKQGVQPLFHDAWLEQAGKFRRFGSTLVRWSGSLIDKSVAILALRGQPTDAETLVAEVGEGHSVRTALNGFFGDDRLIRVSRTHWALKSWGLEEYTGIVQEIAQRINEGGGRILLTDLVEELVRQFGVKEGSVKTYAEAPMFVLEDGWIRLRDDAEPFTLPLEIAPCKGVYQPSPELISISIPVDNEILRGSGRSFPAPVAAAIGVYPGLTSVFAWEGGDLVVTWPKTSAFGPYLGSIRGLVLAVGAQEGDVVRLDFNLHLRQVACELIPRSLEGIPHTEALRLLTGMDGGTDAAERLAVALGVALADVRRQLIERGDSAVAELLPPPVLDEALEAALSELADLLEKAAENQ